MVGVASKIALVGAMGAVHSARADPISKTIELLSHLQAKVIKEGQGAQAEYTMYAEWCEEQHRSLSYEIKTATGEVASLQATIQKESSNIDSLSAKIEEVVGSVASQQADLKAATSVRAEESADFAKEEKELVDIVDTLERAIRVLNKELKKGGASMLQLQRMPNVLQAFKSMVEASVISSADASTLTAFVQSSAQASDDADTQGSGAPAASAYESHSEGIIDTIEGLLEKAQDQLESLRKTETNALHNFEMLRGSLEDEIAYGTKDLAAAKSGVARSQEAKSVAGGDLKVVSTDLKADTKELDDVHHSCQTTAADFEGATKSRDEELAALAAAKQAIKETAGGAGARTYGLDQTSFVQVGSQQITSERDVSRLAVVRFLRKLARKEDSTELAQLASRVASTIRFNSRTGQDPFAKVKGLISDLIASLESAAQTDASQKAYCDKETAESTEKKEDKTAEVTKLSTAIDKMESRVAVLDEEVAQLSKDLASIAKSTAAYDAWFQEAEATFSATKADMQQGIDGVKLALKILRDYYAKGDKGHAAADGDAGGIVGLLETVESDFTKGLAETEAGFRNVKTNYEDFKRESEITTTTKNQDVKYKGAESTKLKKALTETTGDRKTVQAELDAVMQYLAKINDMCISKPEPYEERRRRQAAELAGLKEALSVLDGESALVQRGASTSRKTLRGISRHA